MSDKFQVEPKTVRISIQKGIIQIYIIQIRSGTNQSEDLELYSNWHSIDSNKLHTKKKENQSQEVCEKIVCVTQFIQWEVYIA